MSSESNNNDISLYDVATAYLKVTSDAIAKGKSHIWAGENSLLLAYEKERAITEGMLYKLENDFTKEEIQCVKEEIKELLCKTPYNKISTEIRGVIKAFDIYNNRHSN